MATGTQVIVRQASNSDVREYIFDKPVCEIGYAKFSLPLYGAEEMFSELGPVGEEIAEKLMGQEPAHVDEIEKITFRPFSIVVHKSPTASWGRFESLSIIPAFEKALDEDNLEVQNHVRLTDIKGLKIRSFERQRARA
jgi:hypothetical protein